MTDIPYYDVIVVGAGLSGVCAGYYLQKECPKKSFLIFEGRDSMGGTWDLFKYPGIRSDSDMFTLGFPFYPWKNPQGIADGPEILSYIKETAAHFGIDKKVQYNHKVIQADWSDAEAMWTLTIAPHKNVTKTVFKCNFLMMCSGYYDYSKGYDPDFPGKSTFKGRIVHPQFWDQKLDYSGKKVVIIGSGATAVTLLPQLAKKASHVTMLQRTPTYIVSLPLKDSVYRLLRVFRIPHFITAWACKWKNIFLGQVYFQLSRRFPSVMKSLLNAGIKKELGKDANLADFAPPYNPWEQRMCVVPDGDMFQAMKSGKASIVTDTIERFTATGILVKSGKELPADIIVTATGLQVQLFGGMAMSVNGVPSRPDFSYRGVMMSDCPNMALTLGYTNASWTLKCDLSCRYVIRLLKHMENKKYRKVTPRAIGVKKGGKLMNLSSGYLQRAETLLPSQGTQSPWFVHQNYFLDMILIKYGSITDKYLEYK
eukprot:PhF_6_TR5521/c0_g1_i1/m.7838